MLDAIDRLMQWEGLSFPEAVERLTALRTQLRSSTPGSIVELPRGVGPRDVLAVFPDDRHGLKARPRPFSAKLSRKLKHMQAH